MSVATIKKTTIRTKLIYWDTPEELAHKIGAMGDIKRITKIEFATPEKTTTKTCSCLTYESAMQ